MALKASPTRPAPGTLGASAWFGSQFGASLWMLLAAGLSIGVSWTLALGITAAFLAFNAVGWLLWKRRERLGPLLAIESLLLAALGSAVAVLWLLTQSDAMPPGQPQNPWPYLLVFPLLMLLFALQALQRKES